MDFLLTSSLIKDSCNQLQQKFERFYSTTVRMPDRLANMDKTDIPDILDVAAQKLARLETRFSQLQDRLINMGIDRNEKDRISTLAWERMRCQQALWDTRKFFGIASDARPKAVFADLISASSSLEESASDSMRHASSDEAPSTAQIRDDAENFLRRSTDLSLRINALLQRERNEDVNTDVQAFQQEIEACEWTLTHLEAQEKREIRRNHQEPQEIEAPLQAIRAILEKCRAHLLQSNRLLSSLK